MHWQSYHHIYTGAGHSISGNVVVATDVHSPQLQTHRNVLVYLPPSYDHSDRHYPVLYMHDGQNLFDNATSFSGEWQVDETMEMLSREEQLEAIVVGVPNGGSERLNEYSPFVDAQYGGGKGNEYVQFLTDTVKPLVDASFRTLPERGNTGVMGSSMGGLISLYAFFYRADYFGFAGVMSPSLWFAKGAVYEYVESMPFRRGKLYLDAGTREFGNVWPEVLTMRARSRRYYASVRRIKRILAKKGYRPVRDMMHVEEKWATHNEAAWARRLPNALRFFMINTTAYSHKTAVS